jgi:hypothetical protein
MKSREAKKARSRKLSPWGQRAAGAVRVSILVAIMGAISGAWFTSRAKAEASREGFRLGKDLAPLADLLDGQYEISLNGENLYLSNTTTKQSVTKVLDRFVAQCKTNGGAIADQMGDVARAWHLSPEETDSVLTNLSIVRDEADGEGVVLCFARNKEQMAIDALREFAETQDLGALGKLRYVYARPEGEGATHIMTVWTEGSFRMAHLLREAEGRVAEDVRIVPRPPQSRFVFDASIRQTPYGVRVYRSTTPVSDVSTYYDAEMGSRGWDIAKPPVAGGEVRGYLKEGVTVVVSTMRDDETGDTLVSLVEMGAYAPFIEQH